MEIHQNKLGGLIQLDDGFNGMHVVLKHRGEVHADRVHHHYGPVLCLWL